MTEKIVYEHGLPFNKKLGENLKEQYDRVKKEHKGAILVIDGGVGEAKTTLSVHCIDFVNSLEGLPECDLDPKTNIQLAMGGKDFVDKLKRCYLAKLPVIVYDEAGDFTKRGALTSFNALLNRVFDTFRTYQILVILVLPNLKILDETLFDKGLPRGLLHCHSKIQGKYGNFDAYDHIRMQWIKYFMTKIRVKQQAYTMEASNFSGQFLDLSPERSKKLDLLSTTGKLIELDKIQVKMDGLLSYPELSIKLQKPVTWLRNSVKALGLKPARVIQHKAYFNPDVIDAFVDYIDNLKPKGRPRKEVAE